jgi:hypothetical protein
MVDSPIPESERIVRPLTRLKKKKDRQDAWKLSNKIAKKIRNLSNFPSEKSGKIWSDFVQETRRSAATSKNFFRQNLKNFLRLDFGTHLQAECSSVGLP